MHCADAEPLIDAYIDGELEPTVATELEAHTGSCARCAEAIAERRALVRTLSAAERHPAPAELREAIAAATGLARPTPARAPAWAWLAVAASLLLATLSVLLIAQRGIGTNAETMILREAVSSHIRSLMASHLADVATSDQHTVKPWFAGKLDFSPPVIDHVAEGFPLTGGRLDYIAGRPVAAIVYARRAHIINLFVCPDPDSTPFSPRTTDDRGYHAIGWSDGAMRFCAVSDVGTDDLAGFVKIVREQR